MKKKFKIVTSIIGIFITIGGLWGYNKYFSVDPTVKQQLYNQFGQDFFNSNPDKNEMNNLGIRNSPQSAKSMQTTQSNNTSNNDYPKTMTEPRKQVVGGQTTSAVSSPINMSAPSVVITEKDIVSKYMPQINSLQNLALSRLSTLYAAAKIEYQQEKQAGALNTVALAQKYIQAGNMLEANVDNQFNNILSQIKSELVANNLSPDQVGVIKNEYEQAKAARRSQLLSKALK